ncbi:hypothetical protein [Planktothrix paucivesiculata]|uniref:Uncharacterized protein n=1 Tax=Planktothrix paucivesiculata PCC 9631 TaxID=671071 RepID=A0A7Z9DZD9_9CYAN|nr:hypothetical protein [Planktothrix paucivesiculata]VXD17503.1 membrane hypothetical protein [Planktothrix paucivesiculata PCC 9631]
MNTQPFWLPLVRSLILLPLGIPGFLILPFLIDIFISISGSTRFIWLSRLGIFTILCVLITIVICSLFYLLSQILIGKWLPKFNFLLEGTKATFIIFINSLITWNILFKFQELNCKFFYDLSEEAEISYCMGMKTNLVISNMLENPTSLSALFVLIIWLMLATIFYRLENNSNQSKNNLSKTIVFFLVGLIISSGIKLSQITPSQNVNSDASVTENTEQTSSSNVQTTEEIVPENNEENQDETNYFGEAIETATKAANLAQTAKTSDEWKTVADEWKNAIELMQSVPDSSENYVLAQDRVQQYQNNLEYSQKNANPQPKNPSVQPPEIYFQQGLNEANTAAFLGQTSKSKDEWEFVASQWEKAIENMKAVSTSDINYGKAQQRVIQYQKNLDYARLAAIRAK